MRSETFGPSGEITLYHADALEWLPTLERASADAIITDPPYSSGGMLRGDRMLGTREKYQSTNADVEHPEFTGDNRDQRGFLAWASLWLMYALDVCKPGGMCCLFSDWRQLPVMTDALQAGGWVWRGIVPWDKGATRPMPNRPRAQCEYVAWGTNGPRDFTMEGASYHAGLLAGAPPPARERVHVAQKPVSVMRSLVEIAPPGGLVVDPFVGSGTTALACLDSGRRFIGSEKLITQFDIACARIDDALRQQRLFA